MASMKAQEPYDLIVDQGATFNHVVVLANKDDITGAITPINLTGCTAMMQVRRRFRESSYLIELTTENGRIALGGSTGTIQLNLNPTDTQGLAAGVAFYDFELITGATVDRLFSGIFTITPEITRP